MYRLNTLKIIIILLLECGIIIHQARGQGTLGGTPSLFLDEYISIGLSLGGGYNLSSFEGQTHLAGHLQLKPLLVPNVALRIKRTFSERISLISGVESGVWGLNINRNAFLYYGSINVPLLVRYYFSSVDRKARHFVEAGAVLRFAQLAGDSSYFSGSSVEAVLGGIDEYYSHVVWKARFVENNPTLGGIVALGTERPLSWRWKIGLSAYFHFGFANLVDNNITAEVSNEVPPTGLYNSPPSSFRPVRDGELDLRGTTMGMILSCFFTIF